MITQCSNPAHDGAQPLQPLHNRLSSPVAQPISHHLHKRKYTQHAATAREQVSLGLLTHIVAAHIVAVGAWQLGTCMLVRWHVHMHDMA